MVIRLHYIHILNIKKTNMNNKQGYEQKKEEAYLRKGMRLMGWEETNEVDKEI